MIDGELTSVGLFGLLLGTLTRSSALGGSRLGIGANVGHDLDAVDSTLKHVAAVLLSFCSLTANLSFGLVGSGLGTVEQLGSLVLNSLECRVALGLGLFGASLGLSCERVRFGLGLVASFDHPEPGVALVTHTLACTRVAAEHTADSTAHAAVGALGYVDRLVSVASQIDVLDLLAYIVCVEVVDDALTSWDTLNKKVLVTIVVECCYRRDAVEESGSEGGVEQKASCTGS